MYLIQVVIAATGVAQRFIPKSPVIDNSNTAFQSLILQNAGAAVMNVGDSTVTTTSGIILAAVGTAGSTLDIIVPIAEVTDLKDFYVIGTATQVLNIMVFP